MGPLRRSLEQCSIEPPFERFPTVYTDGANSPVQRSMRATNPERLEVVVSGGSMGGLFTGLALRNDGHAVDVFEQSSAELESRGGGIVAQPRILEFIEAADIATRSAFTTSTERRQYLDRDGDVRREYAETMTFTSWDAVYRLLRSEFPDDRYHMDRRVVDVETDDGSSDGTGETARVRLANGDAERGALAVVAEGGRSSTRERLLDGVEPAFAGYVAWRGVVPETALPTAVREQFDDTFTFYHGPDELILGYFIPGPDGETAAGERRLNWVWYDGVDGRDERRRLLTDADGRRREFSVPPGTLRAAVEDERRAAAAERLPAVFADLVATTAEPFVQAIYDLTVPQMVLGRVCLLGDAAFVARPHTAAGTAKAAADGIELANAIRESESVTSALDRWEASRLEAGRQLVAQGRRMGEGYMN